MTQGNKPHMEPIGYTPKSGRPIWPIMGGDGTDGAGEPQAGTTGEPQAGAAAGGQAPQPGSGQAPSGEQQQQAGASETAEQRADRLERELAETRREAAGHRTRAQALERERAEAARAGMTEAEKAAARAAELEQQNAALQARLRDSALTSVAVAAATKLNFRNPELAVRLLDRAAIEWTDDGTPKGVEAQLRQLATNDPYLTKAAAGDYGGGNRGQAPSSQPGMNELLNAVLRGGG